jgi:hypothetical protein
MYSSGGVEWSIPEYGSATKTTADEDEPRSRLVRFDREIAVSGNLDGLLGGEDRDGRSDDAQDRQDGARQQKHPDQAARRRLQLNA